MNDFTFAFLFVFFAITEKSLSSAILFRFDSSEEVLADNAGFCVLYIMPERHITGEADLVLRESVCVSLQFAASKYLPIMISFLNLIFR
jgi:hypothetical protein